MRGIRQANLLRWRKFPTCELKHRQVRNLAHDSRNARANLHVSTQTIAMSSLSEIVEYADEYLRIREIEDWPNALNGLQIQNSGRVSKIGAAVDVSTRVLTEAAKKDIDLLLVHHGLFWPGLQPISGALHRQLKRAFENDIAV